MERSRSEIETILSRYGADQFMYGQDNTRGLATIQFRANERHVRFLLTLPDQNDDEVWEQSCRQRWRALVLCIKAKLEAVEYEISEFEDEFMAHIVLPGDRTVSELMRPQIEKAYLSGDMPVGIAGLLPAPKQ